MNPFQLCHHHSSVIVLADPTIKTWFKLLAVIGYLHELAAQWFMLDVFDLIQHVKASEKLITCQMPFTI